MFHSTHHGKWQLHAVANGVLVQISKASASCFLQTIVNGLYIIHKKYIKFPATQEEINEHRLKFYEKFGFPGVIGAVDCTHVYIGKPVTDSIAFMNRKHRYSINVQIGN